jgi:hypothetical protein
MNNLKTLAKYSKTIKNKGTGIWSHRDIKLPMYHLFLFVMLFFDAGKTDNRPFVGVFRGGLTFFDPSKKKNWKWPIMCFARMKK